MINPKFLFTLVGIAAVIFAVCKLNTDKTSSVEGWFNVPRTVKVYREVQPQAGSCGGGYSLQNNYQAMLGNDKFISTPSFQSTLSPRFSNVNYGANIRYNMPSYENQGSPCNPLTFGDMAKENYSRENNNRQGKIKERYGSSMSNCGGGSGGCGAGCGVPKCGKGGIDLQPQTMTTSNVSADPYYTNAMDNFYSEYSHPTGTDLLAVGDMQTIGADGDVTQPIVYDRYIYANQKSKLRGLGDPIRGDLAITPCNYGWFNVSVTPSIDLQQGAMNVIGGVSNGTNQSLAELQYATSGGYQTAFGGVNLANQFETKYGAGLGDVNVVAFA